MNFPASVFAQFRAFGLGLGVALLASGAVQTRAAEWQGLLSNSPFGQPPVNTNATPSGELEFRGMVREDDIVLVNIFNTATQKSSWIPLQGNASGIAADAYDADTDKVRVTFSGKSLTLSLKQSRVALQQMAPPQPVLAQNEPGAQGPEREGGRRGPPPNGNPPAPGAGGGAEAQQAFNNLPPEAKSMIEEIRRRRALRSQQVQQPTPATNQPPATK